MPIPCVVIVGRPNVGKSTLFNYLAGSRIAIEEETPGVTRDRVSAYVRDRERKRIFELVDTGGLGPENPDELAEVVERQIELAIVRADVILFATDVRAGVSPFDEEIARRLRRTGKPVVLVANKADHPRQEADATEFAQLGYGSAIPVSAIQRQGRGRILDALAPHLPESEEGPPQPQMKLAIVGRRNVGKSTLVNRLAGGERVIACELAGTTRDAVDVLFEFDGKSFVAIDTAGLRKRSRLDGTVDFYGYSRAQRSVRRADVVVLMLDAGSEVSELDKRMAQYIANQHRPCIFAVNKWDLAKDVSTEQFTKYLNDRLRVMPYAPIVYISAQSGFNVRNTIRLALSLFEQARQRVTTGQLNRTLQAALEERRPPARRNVVPKIYYATQTGVAPPTLDVFVNDPSLFDRNYQRYLENRLREALPFSEIPIRLFFHKRRGTRKRQPTEEDGQPEPST